MSNKPIISNISIFFTLEGWAIWGLCSSVFVQRITLWFPNWRPQGPAAALEGLLTSPETSSLTKHRRTKIHCAWLPYKNGIMKWAKLRPKMVPSLCRGSFQIAPLGGGGFWGVLIGESRGKQRYYTYIKIISRIIGRWYDEISDVGFQSLQCQPPRLQGTLKQKLKR